MESLESSLSCLDVFVILTHCLTVDYDPELESSVFIQFFLAILNFLLSTKFGLLINVYILEDFILQALAVFLIHFQYLE